MNRKPSWLISPQKAAKIVKVIIDPRGRYIRPAEFRWLMDYFRDRYDPRRLCLALCYATGLRRENGLTARFEHFDKDFTYMRMPECKPHTSRKEGEPERVTVKFKNFPLPSWLSTDLKNYAQYRLAIGQYIKVGNPALLFPMLKESAIDSLFDKLRKRHSEAQPWLRDVWFYTEHYTGTGVLIRRTNYYRIASHMGRAAHAVFAYDVSGKDYAKAKLLTGHADMKDIQRYTRFAEVEDLKKEMVQKYIEPVLSTQRIPISKDQMTLRRFMN